MSRKLDVLLVSLHYAPEPTGNAPYVASLAESLASSGHRMTVLTTHPHYPAWKSQGGRWRTDEEVNGVKVRRLRHFVPREPTLFKRMLAELSFGIRALMTKWPQADAIVLVSPGLLATFVIQAKAARKAPTAVWVQDLYSLGASETGSLGRVGLRCLRWVERSTLYGADLVVVIHKRFSDWLSAELTVPRDRIRVLRNWTHLRMSATDRQAARSSLGWNDKETIALHAGNQGLKQGLDVVVEAAQLAEAASKPVRFVLLGDGNQHSRLRAAGESCEHLEFIEPLPDAEYIAVMRAADVLLVSELPGVSEMSVPSKLTSYFASGLPVVAATSGGGVTAEELSAAGAGIRVDPASPVDLLEDIERLGNDPALASRLGAEGPKYVEAVLSHDAALARAQEILDELDILRTTPMRHKMILEDHK